MKILTINTHSLVEQDYEHKLIQFVAFILKEQPDIIAMQEVNQSIDAPIAEELAGYCPCPNAAVPVRADNHALQVALRLQNVGISCSWTWVSAKIGYGKYDEGVAIVSLSHELEHPHYRYISRITDYENWKSRTILGAKIANEWYYTVHMGWWNDEDDPFQQQWEAAQQTLRHAETVWLMGDFNNPAELPRQGYELVQQSGWYDTYLLAEEKDSGITVQEAIDGWRNQLENPALCGNGMRIDQIWSSRKVPIAKSEVVFSGEDKISDHFGVMITLKK
ncbi:endonuclease/exonuclease/phosphatase family protein [Butyricicoccus porcorum]|uniref:Endonuclease/exonuclease/phosphatase domain-containing protein n=1 Tax=Butyricicoccus porcorum TaxID=1945634 RepID=A0A252F1B8_9FIRM|nr:endonuclease/exonuclease/phosphatase family protein [Butyricicoccus porcorum]MCI6817024.1 endonuclease/exonuclease/phosphatase family protein [Clostridium sp.]OUM19603.1 hypothetical protein CBW42_12250 [Butyricicoccus porcorum]